MVTACPISQSDRARSVFRLRESCAMEKLYWMVPPVFEVLSIDLANVYAARILSCLLNRRRTVIAPEL